jgi:hypothetical protein
MLILDVQTQWLSTHQMMHKSINNVTLTLIDHDTGCALDFLDQIDNFIFQNEDLSNLVLTEAEWESITQVAGWLKAFWSATTQMSTTKQPMLSTAHAIFCGLQDEVCHTLHSLPDSTPPMIKAGLLAAHQKLSMYYHCFDLSPFYIWATCESLLLFHLGLNINLCLKCWTLAFRMKA